MRHKTLMALSASMIAAVACTGGPTEPKSTLHVQPPATYELGATSSQENCSGSDVGRLVVVWNVPEGTVWSARFLIQQRGQTHMDAAGYQQSAGFLKETGCQYHVGDLAQAEVWIADASGTIVRRATTAAIPVP